MRQPSLLNEGTLPELREMIDEYPYFAVARVLYLINLKNIDSYKFEAELAKHAIFIPDRKVLYKLIHGYSSKEEFELIPLTDSISTTEESDNLINFALELTSPFSLLDDEISVVEHETEKPIDLIDKFILEYPNQPERTRKSSLVPNSSGKQNNSIDDGLITETLAKIYVKQKLYTEAIKAYEKLSLKFPEKNSYFASQIEKIEILISKEL